MLSTSKHGLSKHPLYNCLSQIVIRCYCEHRHDYKYYGGRGVTVCDEWRKSFLTFYDWAISNGWQKGLQLDRIDTLKGYSPDNCRWTTSKVNNNNRRDNKLITAFGKTQSASLWAEETNIGRKTIIYRIEKFNWKPEEALTIIPKTKVSN